MHVQFNENTHKNKKVTQSHNSHTRTHTHTHTHTHTGQTTPWTSTVLELTLTRQPSGFARFFKSSSMKQKQLLLITDTLGNDLWSLNFSVSVLLCLSSTHTYTLTLPLSYTLDIFSNTSICVYRSQ